MKVYFVYNLRNLFSETLKLHEKPSAFLSGLVPPVGDTQLSKVWEFFLILLFFFNLAFRETWKLREKPSAFLSFLFSGYWRHPAVD
jgi:hypothetical protein